MPGRGDSRVPDARGERDAPAKGSFHADGISSAQPISARPLQVERNQASNKHGATLAKCCAKTVSERSEALRGMAGLLGLCLERFADAAVDILAAGGLVAMDGDGIFAGGE